MFCLRDFSCIHWRWGEGGGREKAREGGGQCINLVNHNCQATPPHHVFLTTAPNTTHTHSHSSPLTNASLPFPLSDTHLLVPQPYLPQVVKVQFRLHILLAIVGNERYLKEVVAHEVKSFFDFGDSGLRSTSLGGTAMLFSIEVRLFVVWMCVCEGGGGGRGREEAQTHASTYYTPRL